MSAATEAVVTPSGEAQPPGPAPLETFLTSLMVARNMTTHIDDGENSHSAAHVDEKSNNNNDSSNLHNLDSTPTSATAVPTDASDPSGGNEGGQVEEEKGEAAFLQRSTEGEDSQSNSTSRGRKEDHPPQAGAPPSACHLTAAAVGASPGAPPSTCGVGTKPTDVSDFSSSHHNENRNGATKVTPTAPLGKATGGAARGGVNGDAGAMTFDVTTSDGRNALLLRFLKLLPDSHDLQQPPSPSLVAGASEETKASQQLLNEVVVALRIWVVQQPLTLGRPLGEDNPSLFDLIQPELSRFHSRRPGARNGTLNQPLRSFDTPLSGSATVPQVPPAHAPTLHSVRNVSFLQISSKFLSCYRCTY